MRSPSSRAASRHDRHDVGSPDARMHAGVAGEVDSLRRGGHGMYERVDQVLAGSRDRDDRPVVVWVGMDVEHVGARCRIRDRVDQLDVAALGEVRNRLEKLGAHGLLG